MSVQLERLSAKASHSEMMQQSDLVGKMNHERLTETISPLLKEEQE